MRNMFRRGKPACHPEKVLFIKLFGMGSIILSYPAVKLVKDTFPRSEIFFLSFEENKQLIELLDLVENERIITIRSDSPRCFFSRYLQGIKEN